jgi:hypothetical protein
LSQTRKWTLVSIGRRRHSTQEFITRIYRLNHSMIWCQSRSESFLIRLYFILIIVFFSNIEFIKSMKRLIISNKVFITQFCLILLLMSSIESMQTKALFILFFNSIFLLLIQM